MKHDNNFRSKAALLLAFGMPLASGGEESKMHAWEATTSPPSAKV
jgi:hypothetical protein